jgi:hypothetical protein
LLQAWRLWYKVQLNNDRSTDLESFCSDAGMTVRTARRHLNGTTPAYRWTPKTLTVALDNINARWSADGIDTRIWALRSPTGEWFLDART